MVDRLTPEHRSWNMSRIRSKHTKPELIVRSALHRMGLRFRLHAKNLPGHPDIVLPRWRVALFVHGCFWHRHRNCHLTYTPKTRASFWNTKFRSNVDRDQTHQQALRRQGWRVAVIWECDVTDSRRLQAILQRIFQSANKKN
jgi:DNA mismatch endonuclease (patch repair protein)